MSIKKGILPKDFNINDKYSVLLFIKQGSNAETYRVKGTDGKYYGNIVWLKEPLKNGKPKVDDKNPDPKYQFYLSDLTKNFEKISKKFFGNSINLELKVL